MIIVFAHKNCFRIYSNIGYQIRNNSKMTHKFLHLFSILSCARLGETRPVNTWAHSHNDFDLGDYTAAGSYYDYDAYNIAKERQQEGQHNHEYNYDVLYVDLDQEEEGKKHIKNYNFVKMS